MKNPMMKIPASGPPRTPQIVPVAWINLDVKLDARNDRPIVTRPKKITEMYTALNSESVYSLVQ